MMIAEHLCFDSLDSEQVRMGLSALYGDNRFTFHGHDRSPRASILRISGPMAAIVRARFSAGFCLNLEGIGPDDGGLAIFHRKAGSAKVRTSDGVIDCQRGSIVPFAVGAAREVKAPSGLADTAIFLPSSSVRAACRAYLGTEPNAPLRLDATPFSPFLATRWRQIEAALDALIDIPGRPPELIRGLLDHALGLLLDHHPHNFASYRRPAVAFAGPAGGQEDGTHGRKGSEQLELTAAQTDLLNAYIQDNLDQSIRVAALAGIVGMGRTRFSAAFQATFGTTPAHHIRTERLRRAKWLLDSDTMSIAAVAAECGFSSQSHLTSALLANTGCTPREYRRRAAIDETSKRGGFQEAEMAPTER
ncbi:helix-turn-helix domain-containing protein [Sphingomonas azotifigens]|uniref:helix-turn-helix domain-containing protein n=1 Tax=Sphingomonas azotifigens TaxID=330920 RepID=UPI0009FEBCB0|nr:AraC family transcriptional regulator [Sphingomonas azotifigens]